MLRLTLERERRGWSRAELARQARMGAPDVGKIESGRQRPYAVQLSKLANALGVSEAEAPRLMDEVERA